MLKTKLFDLQIVTNVTEKDEGKEAEKVWFSNLFLLAYKVHTWVFYPFKVQALGYQNYYTVD